MSKKSQEHLKFTLFPFVSILLATVGVLLFLTMIQAVMLKGQTEEEQKKKKEEENTRVYERIPELNTTVLTVASDSFELKSPDGSVSTYTNAEFSDLISSINKNLLMVNVKRAENEDSRREHLLFVVDFEGAENYLSFFEKVKFDATIKSYLPTGLVLLNPGEKFKLK